MTFERRLQDIRQFYRLISILEEKVSGMRSLSMCNGGMNWPKRGVYFFFELGEERSESGKGLRVVRVGTHGLIAGGRATLWGRLKQHRGIVKTGFGNHRGSVFRLLVGSAIIYRDQRNDEGASSWGIGSSAPIFVRSREQSMERLVSEYLCQMPFLWIKIDDAPGPQSFRGRIERNAIALLSNYYSDKPIDPPGPNWLGQWASKNRGDHWEPNEMVRRSGLWNSNQVDEEYEPGFLDVLKGLIGEL